MTQVAAGLAQMGVGLAVLTETKFVDSRHPKTAAGYSIMCSKAVSGHQRGGPSTGGMRSVSAGLQTNYPGGLEYKLRVPL